MDHNLGIVLILTIGFSLACLFAYVMQRLKLSPILGYLLAGFVIGPYSPGYVADSNIAEQLAEIGVILMLFGVGMHFKIQDLMNVKNIAIPGAIGQTLVATLATIVVVHFAGIPWEIGLILGLAIGVASTVVLVRMLTDNQLLKSQEGHIAIGWLIVEDILTVIILIMLPTFAVMLHGESSGWVNVFQSLAGSGAKFIILVLFMFTWGQKIVSYILTKIARLHSQELFTLGVLAIVLVIATGSTYIFGISIALGAFIAGMVIGKTHVRHQAAANAFPLKDIFGIIFFLSVGIIFNPVAIWHNLGLFLGLLMVVLIIKPLSAYLITVFLGYPLRTALVVAIGLAQIGEFSFILAEQALKFNLFSDDGYDLLVALAITSISLNPLLFQNREKLEWLVRKIGFSKLSKAQSSHEKHYHHISPSKVIIVGFGHIGQAVLKILKQQNIEPIIIEKDIDKVSQHIEEEKIFFGDARELNIMKNVQIETASHLLITISDGEHALNIIHTARQLNPKIDIIACVQYTAEG
ncbi:MAG: cation:proton antiporter, partial [Parachlamydiaceae bacterium]|nr:cation:proton antiporter [Parachlamydiaceae bacterium]